MGKKGQTAAAEAALLLAALIWGTAFCAQRTGMQLLSAQVFNALRNALAVIVLCPVIFMRDRLAGSGFSFWGTARTPEGRKKLLTGGVVCGVCLSAASLLQQWGLCFCSAGKSGFLTSLYLIWVPVLGFFSGRRTGVKLWCAVVLALAGTFLLSFSSAGGSWTIGDGLFLACALAFAGHITAVGRFAAGCDPVRLSQLQFAVTALISAALSLCLGDSWSMTGVRQAALPLAFCGICSSGIAFTLQSVAQKYLHPVTASLLMSLESIFSVLSGWLILGEQLTPRELCGCGIIFAAVLLVQIPIPGLESRS